METAGCKPCAFFTSKILPKEREFLWFSGAPINMKWRPKTAEPAWTREAAARGASLLRRSPKNDLPPIFRRKNNMILAFPLWSSRQGEFHPKPLTEPYVIVSHHTALVVFTPAYSQPATDKTFLDWIMLSASAIFVPCDNCVLLSSYFF